MSKILKNMITNILPPVIYKAILKSAGQLAFSGSYSNWKEAQALSRGYDASAIIDKTLAAALSVKNGEAVYERDSVLFNEVQYSWPLLSGLMLAASFRKNDFSVLDFGGSFGSSYFQNKKFLAFLDNVKWHIVEQHKFVEYGKERIQNDHILFHESIASAVDCAEYFDAIILSSILQYLENPESVLKQLITLDAPVIIIDRTPIWSEKNDRIVIQYVPASICKSSYPARIFSEDKFLSSFPDKYLLLEKFPSLDNNCAMTDPKAEFQFKGFIFVNKKFKGMEMGYNEKFK